MTGGGGSSASPVLILGATGQIGRCLLRRLATAGRPAIAVCRRPEPALSPAADWLAADLAQPLDLAGRQPAAAIHATGAWLLPPQLPALEQAGVQRLVCFSSTSMLAKAASPSAEEREIARMLAAAEAAVAAGAIPWTLLRPALIYGLGLDRNVTAAAGFIRRWHCFPLGGPGKGLRQPVHADDLAAAALAALDLPAAEGGSFNLGGGETLSYRQMIQRIFETLGQHPRFLRLPFLARLPGSIGAVAARMEQDLAFDGGEFWRLAGIAPRRFLAGGSSDLGIA
ncbi:MAG TPA: NAD-dependent epimerase/dehydratase family protein [Verrucomicrobiae bacterium]|nr:NAD-dependent epimerase/dehydratase family protein [Verrucomicrobiae bacterium]